MMRLLLRTLPSIAILPFVLVVPGAGRANDGVLEINQTCATVTGCFPGDTAGFPVTITQPGAYRLTSNLTQSDVPLVSTATTAVSIDADAVTLDLGGFEIACTNPLGSGCTGSAAGIEAASGGYDGVRVFGGTIRGMAGNGVGLGDTGSVSVRAVHAIENGGDGIAVGDASTVVDCIARANGGRGIAIASGRVEGSVASESGLRGLEASGATLVIGNTFQENGNWGVVMVDGALRNNLIFGNTSGTVILGANAIDAGGNACDAATVCP